MQIIPVIDLLNGVVVHAKKGHRQHYQAIQSQLCASSDPLDIIAALLAVHPFQQLYIADLNAIQKLAYGEATNYAVIEKISQQYPQLDLWLDAGIAHTSDLAKWQTLKLRLILASENFQRLEDYLALKSGQQDCILSLDFFREGYQGPLALLENSAYCPQQVIVMSLADVGANQGVNTLRLSQIIKQNNTAKIYAAGGIRHKDDLLLLKNMAAHGVLIASALHQQQISSADLASLAQ